MNNVEVHLPYFKQGDDLAKFLDTHSPRNALLLHAQMLEKAAEQLKQIADVVGDVEVEIAADTHHIGIQGPPEILNRLLDEGLAFREDDISGLEEDDDEFDLDGGRNGYNNYDLTEAEIREIEGYEDDD